MKHLAWICLVLVSCSQQTSMELEMPSPGVMEAWFEPAYSELVDRLDRSVPPFHRDFEKFKALILASDSVVGYNINGLSANPAAREQEQVFQEGRIQGENRTVLDEDQVEELAKMATDSTSYVGEMTDYFGTCFLPHAGFVGYKHGKVSWQLSVCFLCEMVATEPNYVTDGLTEKGTKDFKEFIEKLHLRYVHHGLKLSH